MAVAEDTTVLAGDIPAFRGLAAFFFAAPQTRRYEFAIATGSTPIKVSPASDFLPDTRLRRDVALTFVPDDLGA